ncbi:MAG: HAD family hydrolase [Dehalococcoidia bacterium]
MTAPLRGPLRAPLRGIIFDLGGTLVHWLDWVEDAPRRWGLSYDFVVEALPANGWPPREAYVRAMLDAEREHWRRVDDEHWSGPPSGLLREGFDRLGRHVHEPELLAALDGYARAVDGWAQVAPDARETLATLRGAGLRIGLLSNTWWAADWHNADLAAHGLAEGLDELVYTSDLPHSKPHPSVFAEVAARLGVPADACVMVGDRPLDDVSGAQGAGMRGVWIRGGVIGELPDGIRPDGQIDRLAELPALIAPWLERNA